MSDQLRGARCGVGGAVRRLAAPVGVLGLVVAGFVGVAAVDPYEPGHYPACPMLRYTGLLCPGCGGLRSAHSFAHGEWAAALGANALAVVGYVACAALWTWWFLQCAGRARPRGRSQRRRGAPYGWAAVGLVVLVFSVVRNLPWGVALAP